MSEFWNKKVVLLTGASSGIGEALAVAIGRKGATVGLVARRGDLLRPIAEKIGNEGGTARVYECDVTDRNKLNEAAEDLRREFGRIDILIANAGIGGNDRRTRNLEPEAVEKVIDVNLLGAVNAVGAVLPDMIKRKSGQLVAVSSLAGFRGLPRSAAYSASKAGMNAFFESVRLDMLQKGVSVTIIQPGFIRTPLTAGRANKMPFLMELEDAVPHFLRAIEKQKRFAAFPWPLATFVRAGRFFPGWLYDRIAGRVRYRE